MMSKIFLFVLVGCAVVFASPVDRNVELSSFHRINKETGIKGAFESIFESIFGPLFEKIFGAIAESLNHEFKKIGQRLNTEEYKQAVTDLVEILQHIYDDDNEVNVEDEEVKKIIEAQLEKVSEAFENLLNDALDKMDQNSDEKADPKEFKEAVEGLKKLVEQYHLIN